MSEVAQVADLISQHRKGLDELLAAHTTRIEKAQNEFEAMVIAANQRLQELVAGEQPAKKEDPPQAVWHEGHLVLNRAAASLVEDLLSRTGEVLSEVGKLVSTTPK